MQTRGESLTFAIAYALIGACKQVRGFRQTLSEEERFRVAHDVVHRLKQYGDPWRLSDDLPARTSKGHATPPDSIKSTSACP